MTNSNFEPNKEVQLEITVIKPDRWAMLLCCAFRVRNPSGNYWLYMIQNWHPVIYLTMSAEVLPDILEVFSGAHTFIHPALTQQMSPLSSSVFVEEKRPLWGLWQETDTMYYSCWLLLSLSFSSHNTEVVKTGYKTFFLNRIAQSFH